MRSLDSGRMISSKPLPMHFIVEVGIDTGGMMIELFQLLMTERLSPECGMLV